MQIIPQQLLPFILAAQDGVIAGGDGGGGGTGGGASSWFNWQELWPKVQEWMMQYGLHLLGAISILIGGRIVAGVVRRLLRNAMIRAKVEPTLVSFASNITFAAVLVFALIAGMAVLGVQTTSFVAVIGAAGLAVGFALQGSLSNFAAGVLIVIFKPFKVGDFIEGGGSKGVVEDIHIFTTTLLTPDNRTVVVPNAKLTTENVTNYTAKDRRRIDLVVGVSYSARIDHVKEVLERVLTAEERVLEDPAPLIGLLEMADSSVNFAVRPWVKTADYWPAYFALQEAIKQALDEAGIEIPFPQRDVHLIGNAEDAA